MMKPPFSLHEEGNTPPSW